MYFYFMTENNEYTEEQEETFRVTDEHIKWMQEGDMNTWGEVIAGINSKLIQVARGVVGIDDAEDTVNESWIKLMNRFARKDKEEVTSDGFLGYAATTVIRTGLDALKKRGRLPVPADIDFGIIPTVERGPEDIVTTKMATTEALDVIKNMGPAGKASAQVIVYQACGFPTGFIAGMLNSDEGTVKSWASRGRAAVRRHNT